MTHEKPVDRKPDLFRYALPLILGLIVFLFWPGLAGERLADDGILIQKATVSGPSAVEFWWPGYYNFRPNFVSQAVFRLDYLVHGHWLPGFHLTNLILHLAVCSLLFLLLLALGADSFTTSAAVLLFSIHPARCENVVWISGRQDLVCALFLLGALLAGIQKRTLLAGFLALLACGSKETAMLIPLYYLSVVGWKEREGSVFSAFCLVACGWLLLRFGVYGPGVSDDASLGLLAILQTLLLYPAVTVVPWFASYPQSISHLTGLAQLAGVLILSGTPFLLRDRLTTSGTLFFFLGISPVLGLVNVPDFLPHADRFLYLAGMGGALVIARLLAGVRHRELLLIVIVLPMALLTWQRTDLFTEYGALVSDARSRFPDSEAAAFVDSRRMHPAFFEDALAAATRAVMLDPYGNPHFSEQVFDLYLKNGRIREAMSMLSEMTERFGPRVGTFDRAGRLLLAIGKPIEAREQWQAALQLAPRTAGIHARLAASLTGTDEIVLAREQIAEACRLAPWRGRYWNTAGVLAARSGDQKLSAGYFQRALWLHQAYPAGDYDPALKSVIYWNFALSSRDLGQKEKMLGFLQMVDDQLQKSRIDLPPGRAALEELRHGHAPPLGMIILED